MQDMAAGHGAQVRLRMRGDARHCAKSLGRLVALIWHSSAGLEGAAAVPEQLAEVEVEDQSLLSGSVDDDRRQASVDPLAVEYLLLGLEHQLCIFSPLQGQLFVGQHLGLDQCFLLPVPQILQDLYVLDCTSADALVVAHVELPQVDSQRFLLVDCCFVGGQAELEPLPYCLQHQCLLAQFSLQSFYTLLTCLHSTLSFNNLLTAILDYVPRVVVAFLLGLLLTLTDTGTAFHLPLPQCVVYRVLPGILGHDGTGLIDLQILVPGKGFIGEQGLRVVVHIVALTQCHGMRLTIEYPTQGKQYFILFLLVLSDFLVSYSTCACLLQIWLQFMMDSRSASSWLLVSSAWCSQFRYFSQDYSQANWLSLVLSSRLYAITSASQFLSASYISCLHCRQSYSNFLCRDMYSQSRTPILTCALFSFFSISLIYSIMSIMAPMPHLY